MPTYRFYVNRPVVKKGKLEQGGEHVRVVDVEGSDLDVARKTWAAGDEKLKRDEVEGEVVQIVLDKRAGW